MTNEEKAKEIAEKNAIIYDAEEDIANGLIYPTIHSTEECKKSAIEMAQWKDEQFVKEKQTLIEKVCEWLKDNVSRYLESYGSESSDVCIEKGRLLDNFRKAMEETK